MYVDDCVYGTQLLMQSDVTEPLNIGSDQLVTINQLVDIVEEIAGVKLRRRYTLDAPQGVRGRNSDNTLIKQRLGWAAEDQPRGGARKDVCVDVRRDGRTLFEQGSGRLRRRRVSESKHRAALRARERDGHRPFGGSERPVGGSLG